MPNFDDIKGRVKQAAGELTDDERLEREGRADKAEGKAKEAGDKVADRLRGEDR